LDTVGKRQTVLFDAGEGCSWTAHLGGLDLLQTRVIFISHVHHDHIAGLAGLMENIRAVAWIKKAPLATDDIIIYIPQREVWDNIYQFFQFTTDGHNTAYTITAEEPKPGVFYDDGFVKVAAFETQHMKRTEGGRFRRWNADQGLKEVYAWSFWLSMEDQKNSVTLQTINYVHSLYPEHHFMVFLLT